MAFCPQCGRAAGAGACFCTECGAALSASAQPAASEIVYTATTPLGDNSVMLLSLGSCAQAAAADLLEDVCGYSEEEAREIVRNIPITVAQNLTETQASYLAQAMTEYGMQVTVYDGKGYKQVKTGLPSLFSSNGSFLAKAAAVLGLIGVGNRISRRLIRRWEPPFRVKPLLFTLPGLVRPPLQRRQILRRPILPAPRPARGFGILGGAANPIRNALRGGLRPPRGSGGPGRRR